MSPALVRALDRARRARFWVEVLYGAWAVGGLLALCYLCRPTI